MLNITKTRDNSRLSVALEGRLDTATAPQLEESLSGELDNITQLTIDLKSLDYISSAGLRVLLSCQKKMMKQGEMIVCNPNEVITEIFEVTGFTDILTIK